MELKGHVGLCVLSMFFFTLLFTSRPVYAEVTVPRCAIIVVSDIEGPDGHELDKADGFYGYLLEEGYDDDEVVYLTESSMEGYDGDPNITNILSSFSWLRNTSMITSQPVIYIYDHEKIINGIPYFEFDDGDLSATYMDYLLDQMQYQEMNIVLNGNRSALAGSTLSGTSRTIICSMGVNSSFEEDQFDIARGLTDQTADTNNDGIVSYSEAYWKEREIEEVLVQGPILIG